MPVEQLFRYRFNYIFKMYVCRTYVKALVNTCFKRVPVLKQKLGSFRDYHFTILLLLNRKEVKYLTLS